MPHRPAHLLSRLPHFPRLLCILLLLLPAPILLAEDDAVSNDEPSASSSEEHTVMLRVLASRYDGMPAPEVAFRIVMDGAEPQTCVTDTRGLIRIPLPRPGINAIVTLADDDWIAANPRQRSNSDTRPLLFPLFPADVTSLRGSEREAYAQIWWRVLAQHLEAASFSEPDTRTITPAMKRVAFLNGMERESPEQMLPFDRAAAEEERTGSVRVRLIDSSGRPVDGALIDLHTFRDDEVAIRLHSYSRTNAQGYATFSHVVTDSLLRATLRSNDARIARSSFLSGPARSALPETVTIAVHDEADTISGIVVDADGEPARGVMVEVLRGQERTLMRRLVDEDGYFHFAPVPQGNDVRVRFTAPGGGGRHQLTLSAEPREREWVIPLNLIRQGE